jgi:NADPH:quinone reductase-like Zn-dependent oxidoreductase
MKGCIQIVNGDPASLVVSDSVPMPSLGPFDILIRVNCAGINQLDLLQLRGGYRLPDGASETLGLEVSGTVVAVGKHCGKGFTEGDEVMALLTGGGYAEFVSADERCVMPCVQGLSHAECASIPEAFITAYGLLFFTAQIKKDDKILIHAGASSVGQALIQMANLKGAHVIATTRSQTKVGICFKRGAKQVLVLNHKNNNVDFIHDALSVGIDHWNTTEQYVYYDSVFDPIGASYLGSNIGVLKTDGKLVLYGLMGNLEEIENIGTSSLLSQILFKRISILPSTLRSRDIFYKMDLIQCFMGDPLCGYCFLGKDLSGDENVNKGDLTKLSRQQIEQTYKENDMNMNMNINMGNRKMVVQVDKILPLEDVLDAHQYMRTGSNVGKIVLTVSNTATALDWFAQQLSEIKF